MKTTITYSSGKYTCNSCKRVDNTYSITCSGCGRENLSSSKHGENLL